MKNYHVIALSLASILLAGCETLGSSFSCDITAGDSCLTIEQVDGMTRFADAPNTGYRPKKGVVKKEKPLPSSKYRAGLDEGEPIWIAPFKDDHGISHKAKTLYAGRFETELQEQFT